MRQRLSTVTQEGDAKFHATGQQEQRRERRLGSKGSTYSVRGLVDRASVIDIYTTTYTRTHKHTPNIILGKHDLGTDGRQCSVVNI